MFDLLEKAKIFPDKNQSHFLQSLILLYFLRIVVEGHENLGRVQYKFNFFYKVVCGPVFRSDTAYFLSTFSFFSYFDQIA